MARHSCRNCDAYIDVGVLCHWCVRMYVGGILTAAGGALVAWVLR